MGYVVKQLDGKLTRCPICGSRLTYNELMQYTISHLVLNNGKISKVYKKDDNGPMEANYISCEGCSFKTDCDYTIIDCNIKGYLYMDADGSLHIKAKYYK